MICADFCVVDNIVYMDTAQFIACVEMYNCL